jgi:hypothetical protein
MAFLLPGRPALARITRLARAHYEDGKSKATWGNVSQA